MPKQKKSKKQRKKELEEKRRLEEELLRQQQEEERKRQEELERQRREEEERQRLLREKKRKEELIRLEKENEEDIELIEKRQIDLNKLISEQYEQSQWKKHLKCDPLPDISNEKELNNFLTQWKQYNIYEDHIHFATNKNNKENDNKSKTKRNKFDINHIKYYIEDVENGYKLLPILQNVIFDSIQNGYDKQLNYTKQKYIEMGQIAQNKLDIFTQKCLKNDLYTSVADAGMKEDSDIIKYSMERNIKFGLWASSMANTFKNSKIEFKSPISIKLELPKQIAMKAKIPLACRVIQYSHNFYIYFNESKQYECVGPVINVELLKLPAPPRNVYGKEDEQKKENNNNNNEQWFVQNVTEEMDKPIPYEYAKIDKPDIKSAESLTISYKIPKYVLIYDINNIQLGWWDYKKNEWNCNDFKDILYDCKKRIISFVTCHLSPICIIQPKGIYYEYNDWKLIPSGVERCKISLNTKCKLNIDIEIIGGKCKLLQPNIPELQHIYKYKNNSFKPHELIRLLCECGINLCYKNNKNISNNLLNKNNNIELLTHIQVSSVAALFEISKSKWNKIVENNDNIIIFRLRKPLTANEEADLLENQDNNKNEDNDEDGIDLWQTVMINHEKCTFIDCNEKSDKINLDTPIRELSHKTLLRCLNSYCTEDNMRDLQNTSFRFKETIKRMLNLLNLFRV